MPGDPVRESPRITALQRQLAAGKGDALARFWVEMTEKGTPLFEAIPDDPEGHYSVTFLWRGDADTHSVTLSGFQWPPGENKDRQLERLGGTDLWRSKPYQVRSGHRTTYRLIPNDPGHAVDAGEDDVEHHGVPDPLNLHPLVYPQEWAPFPLEESLPELRKIFGPQWTLSVATAPGAHASRWTVKEPTVPTGRVDQLNFQSTAFGNERRIWVYVPPGYESAPKPGFMMLFDAWQYMPLNRVPTVLDNLLADHKIPPMIVAFVDSLETARAVEMRSSLFPRFVLDEVMPWLGTQYRFDEDPSRRILGGTSLGAMAAAFVAINRPDAFGNVLSQSGAFQNAGPGESEFEGVARAIARSPKLPIRFSLEVGLLEGMKRGGVAFADNWPDILVANRHLRTVLQAKGYDFVYREFPGAHDFGSWPATFPDMLVELIASQGGYSQR